MQDKTHLEHRHCTYTQDALDDAMHVHLEDAALWVTATRLDAYSTGAASVYIAAVKYARSARSRKHEHKVGAVRSFDKIGRAEAPFSGSAGLQVV